MKASRLLFTVVLLALALLFSCAVLTATAAAKAPAPPPDMRKLVKAIDAKTNTIVIEYMHRQMTHPYKLDDNTAIKVNNVPGKFADIKVGMEVKDYMERDNDNLDSISLQGYGAEPAAPKKK